MMDYVLVKYIHILGILVLCSCLVVEHVLLKSSMTAREMRRLAVVDSIYGGSAVIVLLAGLALWLLVGKPAAFYNANPIFHLKLGLFAVVGLLSIYPTRFFLRSRRAGAETVAIPKPIIMVIRVELLGIVILPLLAVLMAQGYGLGLR